MQFLRNREAIHGPHAWILGTLRNGCLLYWRQRRRSLYESVDTAILEAIAEPCQLEQERGLLARDLAALIAELPNRCQSVFELRYRQGCQPKEAARRLGYRGSSIYKITERCLAALSRRLLVADNAPLTASRRAH